MSRRKYFAPKPNTASGSKASISALKAPRTVSTFAPLTGDGTGSSCKFVLKSGRELILTLNSLEEDCDGFVYGNRPEGNAVVFHRDNIDYAEDLT